MTQGRIPPRGASRLAVLERAVARTLQADPVALAGTRGGVLRGVPAVMRAAALAVADAGALVRADEAPRVHLVIALMAGTHGACGVRQAVIAPVQRFDRIALRAGLMRHVAAQALCVLAHAIRLRRGNRPWFRFTDRGYAPVGFVDPDDGVRKREIVQVRKRVRDAFGGIGIRHRAGLAFRRPPADAPGLAGGLRDRDPLLARLHALRDARAPMEPASADDRRFLALRAAVADALRALGANVTDLALDLAEVDARKTCGLILYRDGGYGRDRRPYPEGVRVRLMRGWLEAVARRGLAVADSGLVVWLGASSAQPDGTRLWRARWTALHPPHAIDGVLAQTPGGTLAFGADMGRLRARLRMLARDAVEQALF